MCNYKTYRTKDELIQVAGGKVNAGGAGSLSCEKYGIGFGFVYGSEGGGFCLIVGGGPADKRYDAICVTVGTSDM